MIQNYTLAENGNWFPMQLKFKKTKISVILAQSMTVWHGNKHRQLWQKYMANI